MYQFISVILILRKIIKRLTAYYYYEFVMRSKNNIRKHYVLFYANDSDKGIFDVRFTLSFETSNYFGGNRSSYSVV